MNLSSVWLVVALSVWFFIAYLAVSVVTDKRYAANLQQQATELNQTAAAVTYHFDRSLAFLRVLPTTVADNMEVKTVLHSFDVQALEELKTPEEKFSSLNSNNRLLELNSHLAEQQLSLDVNQIWVLNLNGDCIASSNYNKPDSFVGINYSDRDYFKSAMAGRQGKQYAVGRQTNIPGLFFSSPILDGEKVVGVVVVKIDIVKFSQWLNRFNCFVADAEGVIILSSDNILDHYALVDSPVFRMATDARNKKYKRMDFPLLKVNMLEGKLGTYSAINLPGSNSLYMLEQSKQSSDGYIVFTYSKIVESEVLLKERWQFTILVFVAGTALILLIAGFRIYLRDMRNSLAAATTANNAKSMFLANMSHEIRTPMNAIIGMSYLVLQSELTAKQREKITYLHNAAEALLGIINDILDFTKVEAGKMTLEQVPFVLNESVSEVIQLLEPKMDEKGLELRYEGQDNVLAPDAPLLIGDGLRLRQVLTNLLSNAIKFTEKGFVRFCVSSSITNNTANVVFSVEDSGIGINNQQIARLFKVFSQADDSTTRQYGGTGLGLAIAWRLVTLMGGTIRVKSQLGLGSNFTLEIPFKVATVRQALQNDRREKIDVGSYEALKGMRVLLVEDNLVNRLLAIELLSMKGVITDIAENGEEAVQKLQNLPPETFGAVLMDLQMPVLDGYETTRIIRSNPKFNTLPVIALSAHVMSFEKKRCNELGMNGYINKPLEPEHLWGVLLRARKKNEPLATSPSPYPNPKFVPIEPKNAIKGVNFGEGLKRAGGDRSLYVKVVKEVLQSFATGWDQLLEFTNQQDSVGGLAHAHNLRGALGAIGATEMQEALSSIEEAFRIGVDPLEQILALEESYAEIFRALSGYVTNAGASKLEDQVLENGDPIVSAAWLETFAAHLGRGDFIAVELWENNKNRMQNLLSPRDLELINEALLQFDFAGALEHLNAKANRLMKPGPVTTSKG